MDHVDVLSRGTALEGGGRLAGVWDMAVVTEVRLVPVIAITAE